MNTARRAAIAGLAFGAAATIVDLGIGTYNFLQVGLPSFPFTMALAVTLEVSLGVALGLLATPVLALTGRPFLHLLAVTAGWLIVAWWAAVDRAIIPMWATPAVAALLLVLLSRLLTRRAPRLPAAIAAALLITLVAGPPIYQSFTDQKHTSSGPPPQGGGKAQVPDAPDIVVIVMDTVRAASMSAYGYDKPTTPTFDELAKDGALFLDATSPSTWSLPSHASLFTGVYPSVHGADSDHRYLDDTYPTLAQILADIGYDTLAFTANPWISDHLGLTRGFAWSDESWRRASSGRAFFFIFRLLDRLGFGADDKGGALVASNFEQWSAARPRDAAPAFVFLNFLEAHFPHHQLPKEFLSRFTQRSSAELHEHSTALFATQFGAPLPPAQVAATIEPAREMYDAGVLYTDHLLSRVVEAIRKRGMLDSTLLVVLSDHGELLGEHGEFGHGLTLYEPGIRVPLLLRYPRKIQGARVELPVSTAGVHATVLDVVGIPPRSKLSVGSLLPAVEGRVAGTPVICERAAMPDGGGGRTDPLAQGDARMRVYRAGTHKLVQTSSGHAAVFDLSSDPGEQRDLASSQPNKVTEMTAELDTWRAALGIPALDAAGHAGKPVPQDLDPAAKERLRALGYVE
ncbi:MAG TPA: sulfatase [Candidatus Limnocylindrales bacterium]|nr:sulfatase [Candidatus Limnocylindrales bacterium]